MTGPGSGVASHSAHQAEVGRGHLARIYDLLHALGGRTSAAMGTEEDSFRVREGYHEYRLDPAEAVAPLREFAKQPEQSSLALSYFARTLQLTQLIGHFVADGVEIPVHYCITGAIILRRDQRRFRVWGEPLLRNHVLLPLRFVKDQSVLAQFRDADFTIEDTGAERPEYTQMRISAVRQAMELTRRLRAQLYDKWRSTDGSDANQVLVLSGNVFDMASSALSANTLAIDPQFYAPWQNSALLEPALKAGIYNRSQVLRISKPEGGADLTKYMWFARLRRTRQAVPEFGLLRCTITAASDAAAAKRADELTTRLLAERIPVTFPEPDWDRLIFPVKLCRDYLESMIPSRETVRSYFARD